MYSISAPVVVMPGAENYGYKQHMMKITARRMAEAGEIHQKKRATDLEVFLYLQSATLLAPPDETMMKAIEYLCRKEFPEIAEAVQFDRVKVNEDYRVINLIHRLGESIYRTQMERLKGRLGEEALLA